jgi:hypothetical protein
MTPTASWDGIGWIVFASTARSSLSWLPQSGPLLSLMCSVRIDVVAGGTGVYVFKLVDQSMFARTFFRRRGLRICVDSDPSKATVHSSSHGVECGD